MVHVSALYTYGLLAWKTEAIQCKTVDKVSEGRCDTPRFAAKLLSQICHKQYQTAMQMEEHLSSYDHHHRKRMAETRAMMSARGRKDREKKSKRQLEKEVAKLTSQYVYGLLVVC